MQPTTLLKCTLWFPQVLFCAQIVSVLPADIAFVSKGLVLFIYLFFVGFYFAACFDSCL
jgi:hypothetical protein